MSFPSTVSNEPGLLSGSSTQLEAAVNKAQDEGLKRSTEPMVAEERSHIEEPITKPERSFTAGRDRAAHWDAEAVPS